LFARLLRLEAVGAASGTSWSDWRRRWPCCFDAIMNDRVSAPTWKKVLAAILDFFTIFVGGGYLIAAATGSTTAGGFELTGGAALVSFALIIAYFLLMPRFGGTIWQRVLGTK